MKIAEGKIAVFAGTTEGRVLASRLAGSQVAADVFVATEYGKEEIPKAENLQVHDGRVDENQMEKLFQEKKYDLILDATHPFAVVVTANIREAAEKTGTPLLRILRDKISDGSDCRIITVENIQSAVDFLKTTEGPVFVTTGSKELSAFLALPDWETRIYARVLSMPEVVKTCADMGFYGSHLIAMQGPFAEDLNVAMMKAVHAKWMVTKESGKAGGFEEKVSAAKKAGVGLVVIGRPAEEGISLEEGIAYLEEHFALGRSAENSGKRQVFLIGTGPGSESYLTGEAKKRLDKCDLIVGASRCVRQLESFHKPVFEAYQPEKIADYLDAHPEVQVICGAMSGDTGFYSAAEKLGAVLERRGNYTVEVIPGISSVGYFFAKIRRPWVSRETIQHARAGGKLRFGIKALRQRLYPRRRRGFL